MKTIAILIVLIVGTLCQSEVDTVEQLLAELKGQSQVELTKLNTDFTVSKNLKDNIIFNIGKALQEQGYLCAARDQAVADRLNDVEKTENYIIYLNKRLGDNDKRIQTLEDNRCSHNSNYIERVKNDNMTLRLIIFLRTSLENLDQAQLGRYGMYVQKFLQIYKNAKIQELVELANEFKDTMNVNWEETPIPQGKDLNKYKGELIEMLNQMEKFIRSQLKNTQDLEIATGVSLGDFKGAIDIENEQMKFDLGLEENNLLKLRDRVIQAKSVATQCRAREQELKDTLNLSKEDLIKMEEIYNKNKSRLIEELNLFTDIYRIYSTQVGTSDDRFKSRVDSYVKNEEISSYDRQEYQLSDAVREQVSWE